MLVWVASYPRSGNTLTMLVLRDVFGVGRIGTIFEDDLDLGHLRKALPPGPNPPWSPPPELGDLGKEELTAAIRERPEPFFVKTHLRADAGDPAPALYVVRDGRDALVSHSHFVADRPRFRDSSFDERMRYLLETGVRSRGTWSENVDSWRDRRAPTALIRFEELVADPPRAVAAACAELGLELEDAGGEVLDFAAARERMPNIFRRGKVGSWRDEMPAELEQRFWSLHGEQMAALGYSR